MTDMQYAAGTDEAIRGEVPSGLFHGLALAVMVSAILWISLILGLTMLA